MVHIDTDPERTTHKVEEDEQSSIAQIIQQSIHWHINFDALYWKGKHSFHNEQHVWATLNSALALIKSARTRTKENIPITDPLGIVDDIYSWNIEHVDDQISLDDFYEAVQIALPCHDLGNIAEGVEITDAGLQLNFLQQYIAKDAEERSAAIAEMVIMQSNLSPEKKRKYLPLVRHLILETTINMEKKTPFGVFMRVVDQIGNDLLSTNKDRIQGLLEEIIAERPEEMVTPYTFCNFSAVRLPIFIPDTTMQSNVLTILWGKPEYPEVEKCGDVPVKASEMLQDLKK